MPVYNIIVELFGNGVELFGNGVKLFGNMTNYSVMASNYSVMASSYIVTVTLESSSQLCSPQSRQPRWGPTEASQELGIMRSTLTGWRKRIRDAEAPQSNRMRASGGGRKHKLTSYEFLC